MTEDLKMNKQEIIIKKRINIKRNFTKNTQIILRNTTLFIISLTEKKS